MFMHQGLTKQQTDQANKQINSSVYTYCEICLSSEGRECYAKVFLWFLLYSKYPHGPPPTHMLAAAIEKGNQLQAIKSSHLN